MTAGPYWADDQVTLHLGDCLDVLAGMEPASVDAVVTDPPYGLEFMGREWDSFKPSGARLRTRADARTNPAEGASVVTTPESYTAGQPFQAWCQQWASECLRVLKPGGHLLAFGGTRTWHRLACGIEDAGLEVRDSIHWIYGSGFPKSLDVGKAIDKAAGAQREVIGSSPDSYERAASSWQAEDGRPHGMVGRAEGPRLITAPATADAARWDGWGTALKPAHELVIVARKPLAGTVAGNVLAHGTGALNIDACRLSSAANDDGKNPHTRGGFGHGDATVYGDGAGSDFKPGAGRWPPNVLLGPEAAAELDRQSGVTASQRSMRGDLHGEVYGGGHGPPGPSTMRGHADSGGASRFFPVFRYQAKASAFERPRGDDGTAHPTVKPVDLMAWLARLVTPPGGLVLDPFAGSGTTAEACIVEGFRCVLIERDPAYAGLIQARLHKPIQPVLLSTETKP